MSFQDNLADVKEEWQNQLIHFVNSIEKLEEYVHLTDEERRVLQTQKTTWGTTPYFASLMDPDDPACPIRRQVIPSRAEQKNTYGMQDYLVWKENRDTEEDRPDTIARQYQDRVAFTVTQTCGIYCRHCFRKELVVDGNLELDFNVEEGLHWLSGHPEVRDVLITGGDPLLLPDEQIAYLIERLREMGHIEMIRIGSRVPIILPQRITENLKKILGGYHNVPIWINTQCNHPREITDEVAWAVYELMTCGVNVGNQAVLLKGINDDVETFRALHQKLLQVRIRPYYVFYCEAAPGIDHFRTPVEKGAELIRDALRGHTTGLAQPMHVVATNIGKIPLMPNYSIIDSDAEEYTLQNHQGQTTTLPNIPE
ncbi:MAG: KamA family radical SAM protein [Desulfuromonadales bacterium]|jgi:lysine 2,3-aminomutase